MEGASEKLKAEVRVPKDTTYIMVRLKDQKIDGIFVKLESGQMVGSGFSPDNASGIEINFKKEE